MSTKFQFELLRTLRHRKGLAKGFTLIELLIVVAIIGLLAAIGIPKFLDIRANAEAGAKVGEAIGLAKECAVYVASGGLGTPPEVSTSIVVGESNSPCVGTAPFSYVRKIQATTSKVKCINEESVTGKTTVTVRVSAQGEVSCSFT